MATKEKLELDSRARHELSGVFGDMAPEEFDELKRDIKKNGIRDQIILYEDKILDGWHRYRALIELGIDPEEYVTDYDPELDGKDVRAFVYSKNVLRRHWSNEERVRQAAAFLDYTPGRKGRAKAASVDQVAKAAGVSTSTVKRVLNGSNEPIKEKAPPTIEGLQKREKMLLGQLESVRSQLAELQSIAKPEAKPARVVKRRS